jgi:serine/threonine protein kinase
LPVRVIGHGAFGKYFCQISVPVLIPAILGYVFEAIDQNTNQRVALKRTQKVGNIVSREYEVLNKLKGVPNVVQMLDFFYSTDAKARLI